MGPRHSAVQRPRMGTHRAAMAPGPAVSGPLVSIVILSWNRPRSTRSTLQALADVPAGVPREVIVVDNGSGIQTGDDLMALQHQGLIDRLVLLPENRGTSPGYSAGFRAADPRSSFYTKLDNDIEILTPDWLKELTGLLDASPSVGIASTEIVNHVGIQELPVLRLETGHQVRDWIGCPAGGGGMTFRRSLYEDIGGFRESYGEGLLLMPDDLEFFFRVRERNLKAYHAHSVRSRMIDHLEESPASYRAFKKRQYFLLQTRYFEAARTGDGVFVPHLVSVEAFPTLLHPGQSISVRCSIAAGDQRSMTLGCTVASAETNRVADCNVTAEIQTAAPLSVHDLSLPIPPTLPPGSYLVKAALWRNSAVADSSERLADLVQLSEPLELAARDSAPEAGGAARSVSSVVDPPAPISGIALAARLGLSRATFYRRGEEQAGVCGCEEAAWSHLQRQGQAEMSALLEYPPDAGNGRESCGQPGLGLEQWGRSQMARHPPRRRNEVGPEVIRLLRLLTGAGRGILHVGVGDSTLATCLAGERVCVRGIAFTDGEMQDARRLSLDARYHVTRADVMPHLAAGSERFDIIVDVNLLGLHCCRQHFVRRMELYTSLLGREGLIVAPVSPALPARPDGFFQTHHMDLLDMENRVPLRVFRPSSTLYLMSSREGAPAAVAILESQPPLLGPTAPLTMECLGAPATERAGARSLEVRVCLEAQGPLRSTPYGLLLPDGSVRLGHTDPSGYIRETLPFPLLLARHGELTGRICLECGPPELVLSGPHSPGSSRDARVSTLSGR